MIYHVITPASWQQALANGFYEADSLASEGFIHASKESQLQGVLERYYHHQTDLLLLHINENKLKTELRYELAPSVNEIFPHIYGRLNLDAVEEVSKLP